MEILLIISLVVNIVFGYYLFFKPEDEVEEQLEAFGEHEHSEKRGRVTKITAPPEYDPDIPMKKGGHVVRRMPKQLKKIKEAQDAVPKLPKE